MKKFLVIEDVGKHIHFKNRKVRTPVTLEVTDSELKQIQVSMKMSDVQNWKLYDKPGKKEEIIEDNDVITQEVVIEELEDDTPDTILGRFMKDGDSEE